MNSGIPARIIQTGRSRDLPLLAKAAAVNLKSLNPDFEYLFFDDAEVAAFVLREFPQYRDVFENFPFRIQKYDFFRYLAVFHLGGFYFDLDVFMAGGLGQFLPKRCVFAFEELTLNRFLRRKLGMDWEIANYAFGAASAHPFLGAVIENCVRAQRDPAWVKPMMQGIPRLFQREFYVLNTTGPGLVSRTLAEKPQLMNEVTILFPDDVCDSRTWHQFGNLGIHMMEGSWRRGNFLWRRLGNFWQIWAMQSAMRESRQLGKTRLAVNRFTGTGEAHKTPDRPDLTSK